jgi:hypothetical protein
MKRITMMLVTLIALTIVGKGAMAQSGLTDEQKQEARARYEEYKQQLNLTEEQSKQVDAVNTTYFEGLAQLKKSDASRLSKYKKFKSLSADRDKQMKAILNKEQYKTYKQQQEQRKEEFKQRRANRE